MRNETGTQAPGLSCYFFFLTEENESHDRTGSLEPQMAEETGCPSHPDGDRIRNPPGTVHACPADLASVPWNNRISGPLGPAAQIRILLGSEGIDGDFERSELGPCNLLVDELGNCVHTRLHLPAVGADIAGTQRLEGEA